jgi:hypothetical protein
MTLSQPRNVKVRRSMTTPRSQVLQPVMKAPLTCRLAGATCSKVVTSHHVEFRCDQI